jgi:hypothetical protein
MTKKRKLITDEVVEDIDWLEKIEIETHCPAKWRFLDLETGEIWVWDVDNHMFKRAKGISVTSPEEE